MKTFCNAVSLMINVGMMWMMLELHQMQAQSRSSGEISLPRMKPLPFNGHKSNLTIVELCNRIPDQYYIEIKSLDDNSKSVHPESLTFAITLWKSFHRCVAHLRRSLDPKLQL